jgi:hypothetical protein
MMRRLAVNDTATLGQCARVCVWNVTGNDTVGADQPGYVVKEVSFGGSGHQLFRLLEQ